MNRNKNTGRDSPEMEALTALLRRRILSPGDAERKVRLLEELDRRMHAGIVEFVFDKNCGEQRMAFGTRNPDLLAREHASPRPDPLRYGAYLTYDYYDYTRRNWRSFRPESLVDINDN